MLLLLCAISAPVVGVAFWLASQDVVRDNDADSGSVATRAKSAPDGPDRDRFVRHCLTCHSTKVVFRRENLSAPQWNEIVRRMVRTHGATVPEGDIQPIVGYLLAASASASR